MSRATIETYFNGKIKARWDPLFVPRTYFEYDAAGTVTFQRIYNAGENAYADAIIAQETAEANADAIGSKLSTVDMPAMQAILDQTNAALQADPSQEIKDIAKAVRRLTRKVEKLLDGVA